MESLLRKYLWAFDLAVAAICAIFLARASASLIEARYFGGLPTQAVRPRTVAALPAAVRPRQVEEILKRNIFCSTCPPILPVAEKAGPVSDKPPEEVKSSLALTLTAITFAPPPYGWKWSMAVIRDNENKTQGPYSEGMQVRDRVKVLAIDETRVHIDNDGKPEYLDLIDTVPAAVAAVPTTEAPAPASDPLAAEMERGIKKTGENTYEIQRGTLDQVLGNMALLSRSARIVPEIRDGKAAGFRLYSVRPDGPFAKIGLSNGDVIAAINGLEMTSPEKALEVYSRLRTASHLSLGLERNGQKITKDYNIR